MHTTRAIGATATLLAVLAASGCGGSSGGSSSTSAPSVMHSSKSSVLSDEPAPSLTSKSSTALSSAKPPKPSAKAAAAAAPGVPQPARQHTEAGAKAFARHYVDTLNTTGVHPRAGALKPMALTTCKSCKNHQSTLNELVNKHERFTKHQMTIKKVDVVSASGSATLVEVRGYEPAVDIVDSSGTSVMSFPEVQDHGLVFELHWTRQGWGVATVKNAVY